jgi:succinate-acetate transporter protein
MFERTVTESDQAVVNDDRTTATATLGYVCIGITFWMLGMIMTGWFPFGNVDFEMGLMYGLGSVMLAIIGILTMVYGRSLDTIIFLGLAGLFFCLSLTLLFFTFRSGQLAGVPGAAAGAGAAAGGAGTYSNPATTQGQSLSAYYGWFALCWTVFFCYLWISSFKAGVERMLFLLIFWLAALAETLAGWTGSTGFEVLSGYLVLITAILAFIISASSVIAFGPSKLLRKKVITQNTVTIEDRPAPGM